MNLQSRPRYRPGILAVVLGLGLAGLAAAPAAAAPSAATISITAAPDVAVGDSVEVAIDLAGAADVYAAGVTVVFDPALLAYLPGSATGPTGGFDSVDVGSGAVTLLHSRLGGSPPLSGDLAFGLAFEALAEGAAVLALEVELVDPVGATVVRDDADDAVVTIVDDVVSPTPTPTPTTDPAGAGDGLATSGVSTEGAVLLAVVLLAAAAIALGVARLRRSRSAA